MDYFRYIDKSTDNFILMGYEGTICCIDKYYIDPENGKLFIVLLKRAIDDMKNKGCRIFVQHVTKYDWDNFLKSNDSWEKINDSDGIVNISCPIDDAVKSVVAGFGLF